MNTNRREAEQFALNALCSELLFALNCSWNGQQVVLANAIRGFQSRGRVCAAAFADLTSKNPRENLVYVF
ncbi:MAG: hypothetical protein JWQ87_1369 [Candidatus Sulfotelmatobacter sp.]|nr:hypothetical protein [Candidatus Sulfotelmatobacter sp.]